MDIYAIIARAVAIPVQTGRGLEGWQDVAETSSLGMERVVLDTAAIADPGLVECLAAGHGPRRVIVSIGARGKSAAIQDWARDGHMGPV